MKYIIVALILLVVEIESAHSQTGWSRVDPGVPQDLQAVSFSSTQEGYVRAGSDSVLHTVDGGATWSLLSFPVLLTKITGLYATPAFVFVGGIVPPNTTGIILKSTDNGKNWKSTIVPYAGRIHGFDFPTPQIGYTFGDDGFYLGKTDDAGNSWSWKINLPMSIDFFIRFSDSLNGMVFGGRGDNYISYSSYRTTNGGTSWERVVPDSTSDTYTVQLVRGNTWVASTEGSYKRPPGIYRTTDFGTTWTITQDLPDGLYINDFEFADDKIGFAVGTSYAGQEHNGYIYRTKDGGLNWKLLFKASEQLWYASVPSTQVAYAVGSNGYMVKTIDGGGLTFSTMQPRIASAKLILESNPVTQFAHFTFPPSTGDELTISDILGRALLQEPVQQNSTSFSLNTSTLLPGAYFCSLGRSSVRMLVMR